MADVLTLFIIGNIFYSDVTMMQPAGTIFLRECGFLTASLLQNLPQLPPPGALLDYSGASFERFLQAQQKKNPQEQLQQQQQAELCTVEEIEKIISELLLQVPEIANDSEKETALIALMQTLPGLIRQRQEGLSHLPMEKRRELTTVGPQATLAEAAAIYSPLLPKRRPRFYAGAYVEKRDFSGVSAKIFQLKQFIAAGGFGEVWKAENQAEKWVAVKYCLEETAALALKAESRKLLFLRQNFPDHPHIADLIDFNLEFEPYWLAFEFIAGGTLEQKLYAGPMAENEAMTMFATIVKTMAEVHDKRLYHRDLKPANILLTAYGQPKIADFGLGWIGKPVEFHKTQGATTLFQSTLLASGTPSYMSREQRLGKEAQADDDVYALGVMFYQMLTGKVGEMDRAWQKTLKGLQRGHYIDVIETALLDRGERFADASALLAALSSIQRPSAIDQAAVAAAVPSASRPLASAQLSISPAAKENDDFSWEQAKSKANRAIQEQQFQSAQEAVHRYLMDPTLRHRLHEEEALALSLIIKRKQAEWEQHHEASQKQRDAAEISRRRAAQQQAQDARLQKQLEEQRLLRQGQEVSRSRTSASTASPEVSKHVSKPALPQKSRLLPLTPVNIHGWPTAQVQAYQAKTAEFLKSEVIFQDTFKTGHPGPKMALIPAGIFQMGSPDQELGRQVHERLHQVCIEKPFALSIYAVSFAEYDTYCQVSNQPKPFDQGWGRGSRPVINVDWFEAFAYCEWLSKLTGQRYGLPTEAEWEYACRAGTTTAYWWGEGINTNQANYNGSDPHSGRSGQNRQQTLHVDQFQANPWGLFQMHGNIWEWTASCYARNYDGSELKGSQKTDVCERALRGGSWNHDPSALRSAARYRYVPDDRNYFRGFRVARYF